MNLDKLNYPKQPDPAVEREQIRRMVKAKMDSHRKRLAIGKEMLTDMEYGRNDHGNMKWCLRSLKMNAAFDPEKTVYYDIVLQGEKFVMYAWQYLD